MNDKIYKLYTTTDFTLEEIGEVVGLTGSRVSQITRSRFPKDYRVSRSARISRLKSNESSLDPSWRALYDSGELSIASIASELGVPSSHVYRAVEANYSAKVRKDHWNAIHAGLSRIGEAHPLYGTSWSESDGSTYARESSKSSLVHCMMYKDALGVSSYGGLSGSLVVHHVDSVKNNNSIQNLIMVTKSTHMKIHRGSIELNIDLCEICSGGLVAAELGIPSLPESVTAINVTGAKDISIDDIGVIINRT